MEVAAPDTPQHFNHPSEHEVELQGRQGIQRFLAHVHLLHPQFLDALWALVDAVQPKVSYEIDVAALDELADLDF